MVTPSSGERQAVQRHKTGLIREFILENVASHPSDISALVAREFDITRQAASRHVHSLVKSGAIKSSGSGRLVKYELQALRSERYELSLDTILEEDKIWMDYVKPIVHQYANANAYSALYYGFTEIFNNAMDHSNGTQVIIGILVYKHKIIITIQDNGIGIFRKIQNHFNLDDPRHALLELAKGKLTSDPERHTGEGIFFASRMFDLFIIWSDVLTYLRHSDDDWLFEDRGIENFGTTVLMDIRSNTTKTISDIFEKYAGEANDYGFSKTHVPVNLALYEGESLVSRSQAKRLLARVDRFREVWLDFKDVKSVGPAFADEIFRVFANAHPTIRLHWENANQAVEGMIQRALNNSKESPVSG